MRGTRAGAGRHTTRAGRAVALLLGALVERNGFTVTFTPYDGGHRIEPAVVPALRRFLPPPGSDGGT